MAENGEKQPLPTDMDICRYGQNYCSIRAHQPIEHGGLYYSPRYHLYVCVMRAVVRGVHSRWAFHHGGGGCVVMHSVRGGGRNSVPTSSL